MLCHQTSNYGWHKPVPWIPIDSSQILPGQPASVAHLDAPSAWRPGGRGFNPRGGRQHSFVEIDHEIFSTVILSLLLIQEGQLSVSGERMCTILVNRLEDKACPVNVWWGKLTALNMTPLGWLGCKTSMQTNKNWKLQSLLTSIDHFNVIVFIWAWPSDYNVMPPDQQL